MTDITELAQSLKAAAEKATPGEWVLQLCDEVYATDDGVNYEQVAIATLDARDAEFIALANPTNVKQLVEALEKTQPSPVNGIGPASGQDSSVEVRFVAPPGYVIVPKDVSPEQLRAFQLKTKIGAYVTANWSGAYDSLRELWDVAIAHCPKIKTMD
ncbi:ead/Ea22-like family protein [Raoultella ornithinolytica]|uniref:ead/Ea22-like family protein n=1 Tax=Raoultella ornithinolytica TaxID=54291 RepID=UPI000CF35382|nr:ead/Ea22-like family protein [Raoultella ornithinolytica]MCT1678560.1 ead/Ea22-like family protein [Raoultella ornithinolytica]PQH17483.1 hypothetical protein C5T93_28225 [Raoultella ornithinolytica]VEC78957.1 Uncharacterised protein [Raoultella ornithinolytica]